MKTKFISALGLAALVGLAACAPKPIEPEKAYDKYGNVVMIANPDGTVSAATPGGSGGSGHGNQNQNQNQNNNTNNNTNQNQNQNNNQSQNQSGKS